MLGEAYEGVKDDILTEEDFRDFVFANPVRFWTGMNSTVFASTAVETQVQQFLAETNGSASASAS